MWITTLSLIDDENKKKVSRTKLPFLAVIHALHLGGDFGDLIFQLLRRKKISLEKIATLTNTHTEGCQWGKRLINQAWSRSNTRTPIAAEKNHIGATISYR